ncbi:MAG: SDR family oxidoreductase [Pseudomonadota bacterium]|nr:SDR family oxidoreductase [Pseudomonadota bacterium]
MSLAGRHALVTGAGTGIGAAIARALASEGAKLTLVGRRREKLEEVAETLRVPAKAGTQEGLRTGLLPSQEHILVAPADVTDREQVDRAFALARDAQGPVTILVNNAGAAESAPFAKVGEDAWQRTMAVNLDALLHCCQAALPDLLEAEAGRIVTVASTAGLKGYAYSAPYVAAKHGAVGLTRALAAEYAKTSLTVNAVCPGFTETEMVGEAIARIRAKTGRSEQEARAELARFNPQGRLIEPEEVANAVVWLCLPGSGSINGQAIAVAGGEI